MLTLQVTSHIGYSSWFCELFMTYVGIRVFTPLVQNKVGVYKIPTTTVTMGIASIVIVMHDLTPALVSSSVSIMLQYAIYTGSVYLVMQLLNSIVGFFYGSAYFVDCTSLDQLCC